jgi:hypothetical protein
LLSEFASLRLAADRFCISRYDSWAHSLFGLHSDVLPYYPPEQRRAALMGVRERRTSRNPTGRTVLIGGTATNAPTRESLKWLLSRIAGTKWSEELRFVVAGKGCEEVARHYECPAIRVAGHLPEADFTRLLEDVSAALVVQYGGTGALTRVADLLLAGIPVVANEAAIRQYEEWDGIRTFSNWDDLPGILFQDAPIPKIPSRPHTEEERFIRVLVGKMGQSKGSSSAPNGSHKNTGREN